MTEQVLFLNQFLANDHARQVTATYYAAKLLTDNNNYTVIDLGCGRGETEVILKKINPSITWIGIDVKDSPEVRERYNKSNNLITYDGISIPINGNSVDVIYCRQVFEHVEYPHELIKEIIRVLKPGGHIIGSVSQLEPYHSFSIFNYTIYGVCKLFNKDGLTLKEIRPGIDGLTLIIRRGFNRLKLFDKWFNNESPLNKVIDAISYLRKWESNKTNLTKLMFCGHVIFWAIKDRQD
ncbi:MAG: class I SAM-dependent methyltransferase [Candidatus Edwardsbacteria bacterium]|nr:class I SAM-dependent methyltransferase [Candidatus Edwardsbacteria bacterium]